MRLESFRSIKQHTGYPKNDDNFCHTPQSHILCRCNKGRIGLLPKVFGHILCEDENIFCVFHVPNWVKCLNENFDNTNFKYMRWEQSCLLLHHFLCVTAEKWYCIEPFCRTLYIILKCALGKVVSEIVKKFQDYCIWQTACVLQQ